MAEVMPANMEEKYRLTKDVFSRSDVKLSYINGVINRMTKEDICIQLRLLGLDERGVRDVLKKRLKNYYKKQKYPKPKKNIESTSECDYYVIIDFEGTCEEDNPRGYVHEIIEFPAVLVNGKTFELEDEFHEYCKPMEKRTLSEFCTNLTGISQETVDAADPFPTVLNNFTSWLKEHNLGTVHTFTLVTDSPCDLGKFLPDQCALCGIPVPGYAKKWVNVRKHYRRYYTRKPGKESPATLEEILESLGLSFEGRPHSGIDDARNIARMFVKMVRDGLEATINDDAMRHKSLRML